jgi:hypothetical protein
VAVRLTEERWLHITRRHPEMRDQRDRVVDTLVAPQMIQEGDFGELLAVRFYPETPLTGKFLVVAYREVNADDGFIWDDGAPAPMDD